MLPSELKQFANAVYNASAGLIRLVPEDKLDWKPSEEGNWMTFGQLLYHIPEATGVCMQGFITDKWPEMPEGVDMLPTAAALPSVASIAESLELLEKDRLLMEKLLDTVPVDEFQNSIRTPPWSPEPMPLWSHCLGMVWHQINHKAMLFAYLKMIGVPVNTMHLYGSH